MNAIPRNLKNLPQWINWKIDQKGKKIPMNGNTHINPHDPHQWMSFEEANKKSSNTGIVLTGNDPYICFDFDKCLTKEKITDPYIEKIVSKLNSYTEISQSGTGLHVFVKGKKPGKKCRKGNIEIYSQKRFIAVTGKVYKSEKSIRRCPKTVKTIYRDLFGPDTKEHTSSINTITSRRTAEDVLKYISNSKDDIKFNLLHSNGPEPTADFSAADQSYFNLLAFYTGGDVKLMKEIAFDSAMVRSKWDREDYINRTIEKALEAVPSKAHIPADFFIYDLHEWEIKPPDWLLEGYLMKDSLATLIGETGIGKSFVAIDMGLCIATGTEWHGQKVSQGGVLYFCGEGKNGLSYRIQAWLTKYKLKGTGHLFAVSREPAIMLNNAYVDNLLEQVLEAQKKMNSINLVVIDTLNTNWGDGDENTAADMTKYNDACRKIRDLTGACVLTIHHTAKGNSKDGRGSGSLKAAMDTQLLLVTDREKALLKVQKQKDHYVEPTFILNLETYEIKEGITSCVVELIKQNTINATDEKWINESPHESLSKHKQLIICFIHGYNPDSPNHRKQLEAQGFSRSSITKAKNDFKRKKYKNLERYRLENTSIDSPQQEQS